MPERNQIEMQAIAALEHLGDVCCFLLTGLMTRTTPVSEQEHLLEEVRGLLSDRRVLVVSTKSDLIEEGDDQDDHRISSITGEGLEELRSDVIEIIDADRVEDPLTLPEHWPLSGRGLGPIARTIRAKSGHKLRSRSCVRYKTQEVPRHRPQTRSWGILSHAYPAQYGLVIQRY